MKVSYEPEPRFKGGFGDKGHKLMASEGRVRRVPLFFVSQGLLELDPRIQEATDDVDDGILRLS
jgi:hypothetical protein